MKKEITIREYAQIKGVSVQSVYKRLETDLKPFYRIVNGKKYLDRAVLEQEENQETEREKATEPKEPQEPQINKNLLELLEKQIDILNNQLIVKDKQIQDLNKRLEEMSLRLQESNQLNANNQVLLRETKAIATKTKKSLWNIFKTSDKDQDNTKQ